MTEVRRIIDEIRILIQNDAYSVTEQLTECATVYSDLCRQVNIRLRRCEELLNQGLRAEALHHAELDPNLLDLTSQLDFPERAEWDELLAGYALPVPEPLLLEVAASLNEAYALQEPIQRLLDQHRLYALARSPLPDRLAILRSLAIQDAGSLHWESDIRDMERARLQQIDSEGRDAVNAGRIDQVKALLSELNNGQWMEPIPDGLVKGLKSRASNVAKVQAREQLDQVAGQLHDAQSAMNLELARRLSETWNKLASIARLPDDDPLLHHVSPVLEWIEDSNRQEAAERRYRLAVAELDSSLDDNTVTSAELEQLARAVERTDRGMPDSLKQRYRNRLGSVQHGELRRNRLKVGAVIGSVLGLAAIIGIAVYMGTEARKSTEIARSVDELIQKGELDDAQKLMDENAKRFATAEGRAVQQRLAAALKAEEDRRAEFADSLVAGQKLDNLAAAEKHLQRARELARSADEKVQVAKAEANWAEQNRIQRSRNEAAYRQHVATATAELQEAYSLSQSGLPSHELTIALQKVRTELSAMNTLTSKVAKELTAQAALLESRCSALETQVDETRRKNIVLDKLVQIGANLPAAASPEVGAREYVSLVESFAKEFPKDSRVRGFTAPENIESLKSVARWSLITRRWESIWPVDAEDTEARLTACSAFLAEFTNSPDRAVIERYQALIKSFDWRQRGFDDEEQSVSSRLRTLFSGPLLQDGYMLRDRDGHCYYLPEAADFSGRQQVSFRYYVGFNQELNSVKDFSVDKLLNAKTAPPPHKAIADKVYQTASGIGPSEWDAYLLELSKSLLAAHDVDVFLRYQFLLKTLQYAGNGNSLLREQLSGTLSKLDAPDMDLSVSWMDPMNVAANASRRLAAVLLKQVTDLDGAWNRAASAQADLRQKLLQTRMVVGWIERKPTGSWHLRTAWTPTGDCTLASPSTGVEQSRREWVVVGAVKSGSLSLEVPSASGLSEGTPVFAVMSSPPARPTAARPTAARQTAAR